MRRPLTEEEMAEQIRRAKRFNTVAFLVTLLFVAAAVCGVLILDAKISAALTP